MIPTFTTTARLVAQMIIINANHQTGRSRGYNIVVRYDHHFFFGDMRRWGRRRWE